jgi:hypothetical protein
MFFSFVAEVGGSVCPGDMLDYVPRGWVGELHVWDAHLFILQIHDAWHREALHRLGVQDVPEFNSD